MTEHNNITKYTEKTGTREPNLNLYIADADIQYNQGATDNFETLANVVQMSCLEFVDTLPSDAEHRAKYIKNSDKKLYVRVKPYDTWDSYIPKKGWVIFCEEDSKNYQFDGENWEEMQTGGGGSGDVTGPSGGVTDSDIVAFDGTSGKIIKKISDTALLDKMNINTALYNATADISSGKATIDWANGNKQKLVPEATLEIDFVAPNYDRNLELVIDNTAEVEITFGSSLIINTVDGEEYTPSKGIDILIFKYYTGFGYFLEWHKGFAEMGAL